LLLSELGSYLLSAQQCEAGTKRLSNLIHSPKWVAELISIDLEATCNGLCRPLE
jgi:hypothetical protein